MDWPLRDVCQAEIERRKEVARADYNVRYQVWATLQAGASKRIKPPEVPEILKG